MSQHTAQTRTDEDGIVRYENHGTTLAERRANLKANLDQFEKDAKAGKLICLSDLIGDAESIHVDAYDNE